MNKNNLNFAEKPDNKQFIDLEGQKFNKLLVIGFAGRVTVGNNNKKHSLWYCECDCGSITRVFGFNLKRKNHTTSCGCHQIQTVSKHNKYNTTEYTIYLDAKSRCQNSSNIAYKDYGGRGIQFKFDSFEEFYQELGDRPSKNYTIDRIDNDGHYEKGNVRWATQFEQKRNRRNNIWIEYEKQKLISTDWAKDFNIKPNTFQNRLNRGWCMDCALRIQAWKGTCFHKNGGK